MLFDLVSENLSYFVASAGSRNSTGQTDGGRSFDLVSQNHSNVDLVSQNHSNFELVSQHRSDLTLPVSAGSRKSTGQTDGGRGAPWEREVEVVDAVAARLQVAPP
jgi:hypothetical protein